MNESSMAQGNQSSDEHVHFGVQHVNSWLRQKKNALKCDRIHLGLRKCDRGMYSM